MSARFHTEAIERRLRRMRVRAPALVARALNRAGGSARTLMVREVSRDLRLKAATVRDRILVRQASADRLVYRLAASLKRIPVYAFDARGPLPSRGQGRGVTAKTPARRYPHAFLARMRSGHVGVFQRVGRKRLAIRELMGPSVGHVFHRHVAAGLARGEEQLIKNLQHELRFAALAGE